MVKVVVYVLILCFLLVGCSGKTDSYVDDGTGNEAVSDIATDSTETTGTTSAITDQEETRSNTKPLDNTRSDGKFTAEDSVSGIGPLEKTTDNTNTTAEIEENDMHNYGIELPDDNWD